MHWLVTTRQLNEEEDVIQDENTNRENSPKLEITLPDDLDDVTTPPTSSDSNIQN